MLRPQALNNYVKQPLDDVVACVETYINDEDLEKAKILCNSILMSKDKLQPQYVSHLYIMLSEIAVWENDDELSDLYFRAANKVTL